MRVSEILYVWYRVNIRLVLVVVMIFRKDIKLLLFYLLFVEVIVRVVGCFNRWGEI